MKMVDFDVVEYQYRHNTNIDEDIARLHYPQKYVLLEAFGEIYSLEIQDVTDTAVYLKLTDKDIEHYLNCQQAEQNRVQEVLQKHYTEIVKQAEYVTVEDVQDELEKIAKELNIKLKKGVKR